MKHPDSILIALWGGRKNRRYSMRGVYNPEKVNASFNFNPDCYEVYMGFLSMKVMRFYLSGVG